MPLDPKQIDELKANLGAARKRDMAFGLCLGKKPDSTLLLLHKTKDPTILGRQARKDGETNKFTYGMLKCKGKDLHLTCYSDPPSGLAKKTKDFLKKTGLGGRVILLDQSGHEVGDGKEEQEPPEETAQAVGQAAAPDDAGGDKDAPDPLAEKWNGAKAKIEQVLEGAKQPVGENILNAWGQVVKQAEDGDYAAALKQVPAVAGLIKDAGAASKREELERAKWEEASKKVLPHVQEALDKGLGDTKKIQAVWSLASTKAKADPADYAAAMKAVTVLVKLLGDAKKAEPAMAEEAPDAAGGGGGRGGAAPPDEAAGDDDTADEAVAEGGGAAATAAGDDASEETDESAGAPSDAEAGDVGGEPDKADPADLSGDLEEKIKRAKDHVKAIDKLIATFNGLVPGGGAAPAKWGTEKTRIYDIVDPKKKEDAPDEKKLDKALKDLVKLEQSVHDKTAEKKDWKKALELFDVRLIPIDNHPQAAKTPEVKPKIDQLKTDRAAAVAKANANDFKGAIKALDALKKTCDEVEKHADDFAHYDAIRSQRQTAMGATPAPATGVDAIDKVRLKAEDLFTKAQTDATAGKFDDAVKKLDQIPPILAEYDQIKLHERRYRSLIGNISPRITAIEALPVDVRDPMKTEIAELKKLYEDAKIDKTKDYVVSYQQLIWLRGSAASPKKLDYIEAQTTAIQSYNTDLAAYEAQLKTFKDHKGREGIEEFFLGMEKDLEQAKAEAGQKKFSTAVAILTRTKSRWPAETANADSCLTYKTKREAVAKAADEQRGRKGAESGVAQCDDLLATAANQALSKQFKGALATVNEAENRVNQAKAAADEQEALGKLKDEGALGKIAEDFDKAYKVYTDMRAHVAGNDSGGVFPKLLANADAEAQKAQDEKAKPSPNFETARGHLDAAIAMLEDAQTKISAKTPYETHLAAAKLQTDGTLPPVNIDDCIKKPIADAKKLITEAEDLAKADGFDFKGAEAKLAEAKAICDKAFLEGSLYPAVKANKATIKGAEDAIAAEPTVAPLMTGRTALLQKYQTNIDALIIAGDMRGAADKAKDGLAYVAPTTRDINTCKLILSRKKKWYDDKIASITGAGKDAAKPDLDKANAKLAVYTTNINNENYDAALLSLNEVIWAINAGLRALTAHGTYETARSTAKTKIDAVAAKRNVAVEEKLKAIEAKYAAGVADAAAGKFIGAERAMKEIPAEVDPLGPIADAYKAYDDARKPAADKLTEAGGHSQANAIQTMIDRQQGKFDNAEKLADGGEYDTAKTMMEEIVPALEDALKSAGNAAILEGVADAISDTAPDTLPLFAHIKAAQGVLATLVMMPESKTCATAADMIKDADAKLKHASASGTSHADAKKALQEAIELCKTADDTMLQHRFLEKALESSKTKVNELNSHAQTDYIATDIKALEDALAAIMKDATSSGDYDKGSAELEKVMTGYHEAKALADAQVEYLDFRAKPEVEARLPVLEKHDHRYAIKTNIDAMRKKLDEAEAAATDRKHEDAMKLLTEVLDLGVSSLVTAEMRANNPPDVKDVKAILARPNGQAELDAIVDSLEPDAQRAVLKVAFEARFGCKIENFNNPNMSVPIPDNATEGPNVKRFYEIMSELPVSDTLENDSMMNFSVMDANGNGSFYRSREQRVVMDEGDSERSGQYRFGLKHEVGDVEPGCEPANEEPVTFFSWNTLHEVGHAVDDKHGFMNKNGKKTEFGGWTSYVRNIDPIAKIFADEFKYDKDYLSAYMANNPNPAIPPIPTTGGVTPEEWESRRIQARAHIDMAQVSQKPWGSQALATKLAIKGIVYQESYGNSWTSYELAARSRGMTAYGFRAPGEWFSEMYAAFHSGKMKDTHPAAKWLSTLDGPEKK